MDNNEFKLRFGKDRIKDLKEDKLKTRPIYQEIYKPKEGDKIASIPKEWKGGSE